MLAKKADLHVPCELAGGRPCFNRHVQKDGEKKSRLLSRAVRLLTIPRSLWVKCNLKTTRGKETRSTAAGEYLLATLLPRFHFMFFV